MKATCIPLGASFNLRLVPGLVPLGSRLVPHGKSVFRLGLPSIYAWFRAWFHLVPGWFRMGVAEGNWHSAEGFLQFTLGSGLGARLVPHGPRWPWFHLVPGWFYMGRGRGPPAPTRIAHPAACRPPSALETPPTHQPSPPFAPPPSPSSPPCIKK